MTLDRESLRRSYERSAATYDERFQAIQQEKYGAMLGDGATLGGGRWLDLGCGTGLLATYLSRHGHEGKELAGLDFSRRMLVQARARGVRVAEGRIDALPYRDAAFGVVVAFTVLRIVRDEAPERRALAEIARVLVPGGVFVLTVLRANDDPTLAARLRDAGFLPGGARACGQDVGYRCVRV